MIDQVLWQKIKKGEDKAFEILFREHFKALSIYALRYTQDIDVAQDLTQEVYLKLFEQRENLEIHTSLKSFLYTSVRHRCMDYLRAQKVRSEHSEKVLREEKNRDVDDSDWIAQSELQEKIYEAVHQLPEKSRNIFRLSRFEGKKNQEIADELGISKRTVETQISNALKRLKRILSDYLTTIVVLASLFS